MDSVVLEWIGYGASLIIALSMTLNSIVKFRIINLIGAALFSAYGFMIGSIPVGVMNGFIVAVDVYFLIQFFSKKDYFETLEVSSLNKYMLKFLDFHSHDILKFYPDFSYMPNDNTVQYFVLRNMAVAGILIAEKQDSNTLKVILDYVIPEMRDFKNGRFAYLNLRKKFLDCGYQRLIADKTDPIHVKYLLKMGFVESADGNLEKGLTTKI
ncbi:MAG: hypothetical protein PHD06_13130 [Bacteroidales bacterium]|jgi:hypothetical protein|nr:hypothetical protein [Bacteroidales bacterium]MDD4386111.1 hypothetical protein [Bacteroidales bacterium]MDY0196334.1 hypothetical protein [Tenuifilaceae bacterium]